MTLCTQGRQEDAEEFLGCVLDKLHEEMVAAKRAVSEERKCDGGGTKATDETEKGCGSKEAEPKEDDIHESEAGREGKGDDEWEQVGPKNKSTITRQVSLSNHNIHSPFVWKWSLISYVHFCYVNIINTLRV